MAIINCSCFVKVALGIEMPEATASFSVHSLWGEFQGRWALEFQTSREQRRGAIHSVAAGIDGGAGID
jgi:hypothetical protein